MPVVVDKNSQVSPAAVVADDAQVLGASVIGSECAVYGRAVVRDCVLLNGAAVFGDSDITGLTLDGRVIALGHVEQAQGKVYDKRRILSPDPRFRRDELRSSMQASNNPTLVAGGKPERETP